MKCVIRISSAVHLLILTVFLILCFSFSGVLARDPGIARVYVPTFADPGEDPHLIVDLLIQDNGTLQGASNNESYNSTDVVPVSASQEKSNIIFHRDTFTYKFRFVLYSMFGIYFH
jgi:hypothetical protein